jgi:hypothetical protein
MPGMDELTLAQDHMKHGLDGELHQWGEYRLVMG